MANYYSISMTVQDAAALDGVSPLPSNAVVNRRRPEVIDINIPVGSTYGLFDPGEITKLQNKDFLVIACTVISDGVATHLAGSELRLVSPEVNGTPKEQLLQTLAGLAGMFPNFSRIIPIDHKIALDTIADGAQGPHRLEWTLLSMDRDNAASIAAQLAIAAAQGGGGGGGGSDLIYSSAVADAAGTFQADVGVIERYDASAVAPGGIIIDAPPTPVVDDQFGIKEVGDSAVSITVNGNGSPIESPAAAPAASYALATSRVSLIFKYDGTAWRII